MEFKFRAWDKEEHKMYHFELFGSDDNCISTEEEGWVVLGEDREIMQYTGLKDSTKWEQLTEAEQAIWLKSGKIKKEWNGKEIYEDDIIKIKHRGIYPVKWIKETTGFFPFTVPALGGWEWESCPTDDVEVIGNRYENPKLWKECEEE